MPFGLLKYGLNSKYPAKHHFTPATELKKHYDVVIIGGGGHGAAIAYNLAKYHGITNVAILEKNYQAVVTLLAIPRLSGLTISLKLG